MLLFYVLVFCPRGMCDLSSPTRDWTRTPCIGRQSLNHWTARKVPLLSFDKSSNTCDKKKNPFFIQKPLKMWAEPLLSCLVPVSKLFLDYESSLVKLILSLRNSSQDSGTDLSALYPSFLGLLLEYEVLVVVRVCGESQWQPGAPLPMLGWGPAPVLLPRFLPYLRRYWGWPSRPHSFHLEHGVVTHSERQQGPCCWEDSDSLTFNSGILVLEPNLLWLILCT